MRTSSDTRALPRAVPRAGIVVTGTEVLTGRVTDRNGPWLAEALRVAGVDVSSVLVVGDRPDDLRGALTFLAGAGVDLIVTTGGLGPTADDVTAEVVADFQGRPSALDEQLQDRIAGIVQRLSVGRGWRLDPDATAAATRKQALVPDGASVLPPVGTAPGLVVPVAPGRAGPPVVVLPGPPRELKPMWPVAFDDAAVAAAVGGRAELRQRTVRLWNTPESELAAVLRAARPDVPGFDDLEITTCLREGGELEIVTRFAPTAAESYDRLHEAILAAFPTTVFSPDGATLDDIVAIALLAQGRSIATAESCTAGLLAGRLTDRPGSSAYVRGGLVVYSNEAKTELAGVPADLIERVGAVSEQVARALAAGARDRLGADFGVGVTGVAGPDGGTPDKPVGLVHLAVAGPDGTVHREVRIPGARADVRQRTVTIALHMLRTMLLD